MNIQKVIKLILPVLIIALTVGTFLHLKSSKSERKKPVAQEKVWLVDVLSAERQSLSPELLLYGEAETPDLLKAAAPGAGLVSSVLVRAGEMVKKGQLLVEMDDRDFSASYLQANADVLDIKAQISDYELRYQANLKFVEQENNLLVLAKKEVKRIERLKKNNLTSESALSDAYEMLGRQQISLIAKQLEVDRYKTTQKQYQAKLTRARARLTETQLAKQRSSVVAEFDGVIVDVPVSAGDRVRTADVLVSIYPQGALEVRASISSNYQAEVQRGLVAGFAMPATGSISNNLFDLKLLRLAGEASTSGIDAYFQVKQGGFLRIGNMLKVKLQLPVQENVIAVPYRAIYGNDRVYLLRDGRMTAVDVETIGQNGTVSDKPLLLIRSDDIQQGDQIITTHLPNAVDGLKVKTVTDS